MNKETSENKKIMCTESVSLAYDANFYYVNVFNKNVKNHILNTLCLQWTSSLPSSTWMSNSYAEKLSWLLGCWAFFLRQYRIKLLDYQVRFAPQNYSNFVHEWSTVHAFWYSYILLVFIWLLESRLQTDLDSKLGGLRVWEEEVSSQTKPHRKTPQFSDNLCKLWTYLRTGVDSQLLYRLTWTRCPWCLYFKVYADLVALHIYLKRTKSLQSCRYSFRTSTGNLWTRQLVWWGNKSWTSPGASLLIHAARVLPGCCKLEPC